jgi:hypothetical protein
MRLIQYRTGCPSKGRLIQDPANWIVPVSCTFPEVDPWSQSALPEFEGSEFFEWIVPDVEDQHKKPRC